MTMPCYESFNFSTIACNMSTTCSLPCIACNDNDKDDISFRMLCPKCLHHSMILASKIVNNCSFLCLVCKNAYFIVHEMAPIAFSLFDDHELPHAMNAPSCHMHHRHAFHTILIDTNGDVHKTWNIMMDDVFLYHAHTLFVLLLPCVGTRTTVSTATEHELTKRAIESHPNKGLNHGIHTKGYVPKSLRPRVCLACLVELSVWPNSSSPLWPLMQHSLTHLVGTMVVVCLDAFIIHSDNLKDHVIHVRDTLCILCHMSHKKLLFFGFLVLSMAFEMDSLTLEDTHTWLTTTILSQARSFHLFSIAHNNFAHNFAAVTCLLIVPFVWDNATHHIFDTLQSKLLHAQTFAPPNFGYIDTLLVPIFTTCLLEKRLDASYLIESLLFADHQFGMHKLSICKLFFPKLFFDRDFIPLPQHGRTVLDYTVGEKEQEPRTTLPQGGGGEMM